MPSNDFSQRIRALKIARLVCSQKNVVIMIPTRLKTSRRTPIANNPRHVSMPIMILGVQVHVKKLDKCYDSV